MTETPPKSECSVLMRCILEKCAAAFWIFQIIGHILIGVTVTVFLLFSPLWFVIVAYIVYIYFDNSDEHGGNRWEWMRDLTIWRYLRDYFSATIIKDGDFELDAKRNYLFCMFPHGVLCTSAFMHCCTNATEFGTLFPKHTPHLIMLGHHFKIPFHREFQLWLGTITSTRKAITNLLTDKKGGQIGTLMVCGASGIVHALPNRNDIILKQRKGFVKIALATGSPLVPVYSFNENYLYDQFQPQWLVPALKVVKKIIGFPPVILLGCGFLQNRFGLIPRKARLTTVVGEPIYVPKIETFTDADVTKYHALFEERLVALFEKYKGRFLDDAQAKLIIH